MDYTVVESDVYAMSSYHSEISRAVDSSGRMLIVKRNRGKASDAQVSFLRTIMDERPEGILIPLNVRDIGNGRLEEVYDFVEHPDLRRFISEKLLISDGEPVSDDWNYGVVSLIALQLAQSSSYIHRKGFVHHDLRGNNIFVNPNGLEATIFDYSSLSEPYFLEGGVSVAYPTPPEYKRGNTHIDFRFDVWQMGNLLKKMTHGYSDNPRVEVPSEFLTLVQKAMAENPDERYADASEMLLDIAKLPDP